MLPLMSDVSRILSAIQSGDRTGASEEERARARLAAEQLLPLVYDELRKLAHEKASQKLSAMALIRIAESIRNTNKYLV